MPVFFHSQLAPPGIPSLAATPLGEMTLIARRGPKDRLRFSLQYKLYSPEFDLTGEYTSEERTDADPAVGTLGDTAYVAWKSPKADRVHFARVRVEITVRSWTVVGLADRETFELPMRGPLTLTPQEGQRFLLGHTDGDGRFAFATVVPFDPTFTDPLPPDAVGCELCGITRDDECYLTNGRDVWEEIARFSGRPRVTLGPGWYPLLLVLKDGRPDQYAAGDLGEWQSLLGRQVYVNELGDFPEDGDGAERPLLRYLAISDAGGVKWSADALGRITRKALRKRYDKLATLAPSRRPNETEFESAWQALDQLVAFLRGLAEKGMSAVHRSFHPASPPPPLPKVGKVTVKVPTAKKAAAPHPDGLGVLAEAADSFGVKPNAPTNEWPFNVLSQKAVRYASGRIARAGDDPPHDYDAAELERCHRIAAEAAVRFARLPVRNWELGEMEAFCLPAGRGDKPPRRLTADHVRAAFRGTLHPWANVVVEPVRECGVRDVAGQASIFNYPTADVRLHNLVWADAAAWFEGHPHVTGQAWSVSAEGDGWTGCKSVRLVVGLTAAGSLAGVATVGPGHSLGPRQQPGDVYRIFREDEGREFARWRDPATGRVAARAVLRTYDAESLLAWSEKTEAACGKLKPKDRTAHWLAEFARLTPTRTLTLSPAWEAVFRCTAGGRLNGDPGPGARLFHGDGWDGLGGIGSDLGFFASHGDRLLKVAHWLTAHSGRWLQRRYDDLRATGYAPFISAADKQAAVDAFEAVREFYLQATDETAVVVEITTRPVEVDTRPQAEDKAVARKGKAGKKDATAVGGCRPTNEMIAPLIECMEDYRGEGEGEWSGNDISQTAERYTCGNIAREGETIPHDHDPAEVERCRAVAAEAENQLAGLVPPHDQGGPYQAFFSAANRGEPVPEALTEQFVRERLFRGTINPACGVRVEPLTGERVWEYDGAKAAGFVDWFRGRPGLHGWAFVSIGLSDDEGGPIHPRLAVALTDNGSVVGVCGHVIWA